MTQTPQLQDLSSWIAHIRGREMPVFARTVEALRRIIGDERASASALAQIILKDVSMTAKVLRLANSAFFNHSHQGVSTVPVPSSSWVSIRLPSWRYRSH